MPLLAVLALLAPGVAAAHACEEEVEDLAGKVTRLENLVAADRAVVKSAASIGGQSALVLEALEQKLQSDQADLQQAWQRLLESQRRCTRLVDEEARAARGELMALVALDVKAAYAIPVGNVWGSSSWNPAAPMSGAWTGAVPLEVAVRYLFTPNVSAGAYFQWGPAFVTSPGFNQRTGSSGSDMRVGVELMYELDPESEINPWFLLGTGWGWTSYSASNASTTLSGWDYLKVQAGVDLKLAQAFSLGPYVGFSAGTYTNIVATGAWQGWGGAVPLDARSFHGWLQYGLSGTAKF